MSLADTHGMSLPQNSGRALEGVAPDNMSLTCSSLTRGTLAAIPELLQAGVDSGVELTRLGHLLAQRGGEQLHLLLERLAAVFLRLGAHVATRREHVAVLADLVDCGAFAEPGDVRVLSRLLLPAPGVVGIGDPPDVVIGQLTMRAVYHAAELASVDKKHPAAP